MDAVSAYIIEKRIENVLKWASFVQIPLIDSNPLDMTPIVFYLPSLFTTLTDESLMMQLPQHVFYIQRFMLTAALYPWIANVPRGAFPAFHTVIVRQIQQSFKVTIYVHEYGEKQLPHYLFCNACDKYDVFVNQMLHKYGYCLPITASNETDYVEFVISLPPFLKGRKVRTYDENLSIGKEIDEEFEKMARKFPPCTHSIKDVSNDNLTFTFVLAPRCVEF